MAATTDNRKTISMVQGVESMTGRTLVIFSHLIHLVTKYLLRTTYHVLYRVLPFQ